VADGNSPEQGNEQQQQQQSILPEELQGKSAEEIYSILDSEHNRVLSETVQSLSRQTPAQPEQQPKPPKQQPKQQWSPQQYQQPQQQQQQQERIPDPYLDPQGYNQFMDEQFNRRMSPLVQQQSQAMRGTNRELFQSKIPSEEWSKFGEEVESFIDNLHPQLQGHPDAYKTAYNIVLAGHKDEIIEEQSSRKTLTVLTKVLAGLGMEPDQITDALRKMASGDNDIGMKLPEAPKQEARSLFQPNTGVRSTIVDPLSQSIRSLYPKSSSSKPKKAPLSEDAKQVMAFFEMDEKEYDEFASQNTDLISQIARNGGI